LVPGNVIGIVRNGSRIEVLAVAGNWAQVSLQAGGASIDNEAGTAGVTAYLWAPLLGIGTELPAPMPVVEPLPMPAQPGGSTGPHPASPVHAGDRRARLGVHAMSNGHLAMQEAAQGCRFFLLMDAFSAASELKQRHPEAIVMVRKYFGTNVPLIDDAMRGLEGAADRGLIYTGLNESDAIGTSAHELRERARFDLALAERVRAASGATYAACTFSMGNPDFTNPEVCAVMREMYAPAYNSGLIAMDMHNYSPDLPHIDKPGELKWYERRWEFLFTHCGFDPRIRAIYSSETGVDEGGVGGFPAHNTSEAQFEHWCTGYIAAMSAPLDVSGISWPSPFVGGAIFQLGGNNDPRWAGYDITNYLGVLRRHY
jgi:hypothetical protein